MAPVKGTTKALAKTKTFEAQSHGFGTRCLRFAASVTTVDARLASGRWSNATRRDSHPKGHYQRFQISIHIVIILLRQASWRNPLFTPLSGSASSTCASLGTSQDHKVTSSGPMAESMTRSIKSDSVVRLAECWNH